MTRFAGNLPEVVRVARSQIGVTERPARSNRTPYGQWFGWNGVPWCVIFASWVFDRAGNRLPPLSNRMGAAYTPTVKSHAQRTGQWRGRSYNPKPGDLIVFWFTSRPDHLGIVAERGRLPDGRVHTIEGNTGADNRNGGRVLERFRSGGIHGFVAVDQIGAPPQPRPPVHPQPQPEPQPEIDPEEDDDMAQTLIRHHDGGIWHYQGKARSHCSPSDVDRYRFLGVDMVDVSQDRALSDFFLKHSFDVAHVGETALRATWLQTVVGRIADKVGARK